VLVHHKTSSASSRNGGPADFQEARYETGQSLERSVRTDLSEMSARSAALEEECVALVVAGQETHSSGAVPVCERVRLVLTLVVRPLNFEDSVPGWDDMGDEAAGEWLLELKIPLLCALGDEARKAFLPVSV
jgi:hypothetical protein